MRRHDAIYGGELSSHHYFRDFMYCDSGMIPWVLIINLLNNNKKSLSQLIKDRQMKFPSSGEMNFNVIDPEEAINKILVHYKHKYLKKDLIDGLSLIFDNWRLNVRQSNTESLIRLNIETKRDKNLIEDKTREICNVLNELVV